jgi:hypothetical protein
MMPVYKASGTMTSSELASFEEFDSVDLPGRSEERADEVSDFPLSGLVEVWLALPQAANIRLQLARVRSTVFFIIVKSISFRKKRDFQYSNYGYPSTRFPSMKALSK